jgi:magnesium transporter
MCLTERLKNASVANKDHSELEVLLESFAKQAEEIVNEAENTEVCSHPSVIICMLILLMRAEQRAVDARDRGAAS